MSDQQSGQSSGHHVVPVSTYVGIFLILMVLTGLTTGVAFIDLHAWNTPVALTIAVVKMLLVLLFFMHVKYSPKLTQLVVGIGFFFLAILVAMTLADELTRGWSPKPLPWSMLLPNLSRFLF
jgi:cytochrome c oxidase subunit IV